MSPPAKQTSCDSGVSAEGKRHFFANDRTSFFQNNQLEILSDSIVPDSTAIRNKTGLYSCPYLSINDKFRFWFFILAIMARRHIVRAHLPRLIDRQSEFYFLIANHARVWRPPGFGIRNKPVHDHFLNSSRKSRT